MNFTGGYQRFLEWIDRLTKQPDYHALTHEFLNLLQEIPGVHYAAAFEVYGGKNRKACESCSVCEHMVRRFPIDLSDETQDEYEEMLADFIGSERELIADRIDAAGLYTRVVALIRELAGPNRALLLEGQFDQNAIDLFGSLIKIYRNLVTLHDSKERDTLTRLPNRQTFDKRLLQICEHYLGQPVQDIQHSKSSWFAILDIDHFKQINDNFGHLYGDEVLLIFSQMMEKHFRYNDFLFRFGGEEFVVILNLVDQQNAETVFERFRQRIAEHEFPTVGKVTVSIGLTHVDSAIMPSTLLDRADKALYHAKANGRNQVVMYEKTAELAVENLDNEPDLF